MWMLEIAAISGCTIWLSVIGAVSCTLLLMIWLCAGSGRKTQRSQNSYGRHHGDKTPSGKSISSGPLQKNRSGSRPSPSPSPSQSPSMTAKDMASSPAMAMLQFKRASAPPSRTAKSADTWRPIVKLFKTKKNLAVDDARPGGHQPPKLMPSQAWHGAKTAFSDGAHVTGLPMMQEKRKPIVIEEPPPLPQSPTSPANNHQESTRTTKTAAMTAMDAAFAMPPGMSNYGTELSPPKTVVFKRPRAKGMTDLSMIDSEAEDYRTLADVNSTFEESKAKATLMTRAATARAPAETMCTPKLKRKRRRKRHAVGVETGRRADKHGQQAKNDSVSL